MKLPFEFGSRFVLRLLLPGALLGAASLPILLALRDKASVAVDDLSIFLAGSLVFGWVILLSDMPIYMLFEGRRYWPQTVRRWGLRREAARLARLTARADDESLPEAVRREYQISRADGFPITIAGLPETRYPTKLGNVLTAFEEYPRRKYGLDGVFFWHRLWLSIDKDLREELDNAQAVVDGALYLALALVFTGALSLAYAGVRLVEPNALPALYLSPGNLFACAVAALASSRALYLLSLHGQHQYGELFKALFDQHRDKIATDSIVRDLAAHFNDPNLLEQPERQRNLAAWRFLRWHRYRTQGTNLLVTNWED